MKEFRTLIKENLLGISLTLIGLACLAVSGVIYFSARSYPSFVQAEVPGLDPAQVEVLEAQNQAFAAIARAVTPAVVNVGTKKVIRVRQSPFMNDPFFRQFFGDFFGVPRERVEQSLGSGVIVTPEGYIVTNNHVIAQADEIKVLLSDRREFEAELVGTDPATDVAVIKVKGENLPTVPWGDSAHLQVGETVLAFGNPFGLNFTVTRGMVSAVGRPGMGLAQYGDFIQTDAAINMGNSGGALVNVRGELVGINLATTQGGFSGVGFAIPSAMARSVFESLVKTGRVVRGFLGVSVMNLNQALANQYNAPSLDGVLVSNVSSSGPAGEAGLRRGDIILEFNGATIRSDQQWIAVVASTAPGTPGQLRILRDGEPLSIQVEVGEQPSSGGEGISGPISIEEGVLRGVEIQDLTPEILSELRLSPDTQGVLISGIDGSSPAARVGLGPGDIIMGINRRPVRSVEEYESIAGRLGGAVSLQMNRQGFAFQVTISTRR